MTIRLPSTIVSAELLELRNGSQDPRVIHERLRELELALESPPAIEG